MCGDGGGITGRACLVSKINRRKVLRGETKNIKLPPVQIIAEYVPSDSERSLRALMLVLNVEPVEIERLLKERRERKMRNEGLAA